MFVEKAWYIKAVKSYAALQLRSIIYERRGGSKEIINLGLDILNQFEFEMIFVRSSISHVIRFISLTQLCKYFYKRCPG